MKRSQNPQPRRRQISGENSQRQQEDSTGNNPLYKLFLDEMADIYNAEQQLVKALPRMAKAAQSDELREAFESHLTQTEGHVKRIEQAMESIGESLKRKKCKAMEGLLEEGEEIMEENKGEPTIDAALIAAAQKVEHYEIASYGTVCAWAGQMGHADAVSLLQENLQEEKAADEKLTEIAESSSNFQAENETEEKK